MNEAQCFWCEKWFPRFISQPSHVIEYNLAGGGEIKTVDTCPHCYQEIEEDSGVLDQD